MNEITIGIIGLIVLLGLFLTGMEMFIAMTVLGFAGYAVIVTPGAGMAALANDFHDSLENYSLTVVPLFILMGQIAFNTGLAMRLYNVFHKFIGHIAGGLAVATVIGAALFKTMCGSLLATSATFASVAVPEMDKFKYSKRISCGIVASVSVLGSLLPPSTILIILGILTQESIGKLFLAGIIPGILLTLFYMIVVFGWSRINPTIGPASNLKFSWKEKFKTLPEVIWPLLIFVIMIGGIMQGVFTPTEGGSIGVFSLFIVCLLKRDLTYSLLRKSLQESLRTACMILMLVAASTIFGHFIAVSNIPAVVADWSTSLPFHRHFVLIIILFIYILGGSFMDDLAFMILGTPIFFPVIMSLGYDPIWSCILIATTIGIGCVIPPVAAPVFIVKNITKVPLMEIYKGVTPFLIALIFLIVLMFIFPGIITWLPSVLMPS
ncbi:MAG: TRAP transporter large permease [Spirochaetes bacterium]|nr:TRAP transporter large permease [Spirochaetota bacterium]